jgi:methylglutaconyl-CoA hydratase
MSYRTIEVQTRDRVATVWLNRPEVRNALNETVIAELDESLTALGANSDIRVVVLAGRGKAFCAGADLQWMRRTATYGKSENEADAMRLATMLRTLYQCPKPTIARVHGPAYAGGMGLAAACDMVIAAKGAEFCLSEVRIGLVPATISPYVVQALGVRAARRYMLTAERLSAVEAHRIGFVHELREPDELDSAVDVFASSLCMAGPAALAQSKALIDQVSKRPVEIGLITDTAALIAYVRASAEGREGVDAFLQKRKAEWACL